MLKLFIKRSLLIIIGIMLSLILLECGLRLAGWTISSYQQYKNNKALRNKSQYTIMCLGESTTAKQYPVQLQEILDIKYPNKFSVIDCGIVGITLENILNMLDNNINKYNPNIAICMMGINGDFVINFDDENINLNYIKKTKSINLKTVKLYLLIKQHLMTLIQQKNIVFAKNISDKKDSLLEYAIGLINIGKYDEAEEILKKILKNNPNDEMAFKELVVLYDFFNEDETRGYNMATYAINNGFSYGKEFYYKNIFEYNYCKKDINSLKYYIEKAINEDLYIFSTNLKYFLYSFIKHYITEEQKKKIFKTMINSTKDLKILAIDAIEQKDYKKAQNYFDNIEKIRLNFPNMDQYDLYKLIVKKLIDNNIKVICMQYPIRSIKTLQVQLKNELYYDKLTFISNEKLFKDILMKKNYDDLFNDQFAGDFGHCTDLGNTLIAENVVHTLEKILDLKQN